jgi:hypothetical protein
VCERAVVRGEMHDMDQRNTMHLGTGFHYDISDERQEAWPVWIKARRELSMDVTSIPW